MPGVVVSIVEAELHDADGPQLYAGPQEFAPQLAVTNHVPLLSLSIGSHDGRMVHDLQENGNLNQTRESMLAVFLMQNAQPQTRYSINNVKTKHRIEGELINTTRKG